MVTMEHNYSKYSDNKKKNKIFVDESTAATFDESQEEVLKVDETVENATEVVTEVTSQIGVVSGCNKLNVREKANKDSKSLCVIDKNTEVEIDLNASTTEEFYKVCTSSGIKGYCMKQYITVK